jgi:predicted transglutaminase-like cysteine proteinase
MHALVNAPVPSYDEKTNAVLLYSETNVTVLAADKINTQFRVAYKILRPEGREYGMASVFFSPERRVKSLRGWCIPAQGKDFEVRDKDALDVSLSVDGGELASDNKVRILQIPAPDPGNIVGYEYEVEERPFFLQDRWDFQRMTPVRESHYSLQLPAGWEFKAAWLNAPEIRPVDAGNNLWKWTLQDIKGVRTEAAMPSLQGVMGQMIVTLFSPGGRSTGFSAWRDMGEWYTSLVKDRVQASPEIKEKVAQLVAGKSGSLEKMQAIAQFVQHDIRYVAIELGIGGFQPHAAPEVFSHHYGDCKDKATLMRSMLHEIGVDSYHVLINTRRGTVGPDMPAHNGFDHAIMAIHMPDGQDHFSAATIQHPKFGRLLFFDPTDEVTPLGEIKGELQANYALLVTPDGGELLALPQQPSAMNGVRRQAKLTLDATGRLAGDVKEVRVGDRAWEQRWGLRMVTKDSDRIKPLESILAGSLPNYHITHATITNLQDTAQPFGFDYSFESQNYAKNAGGLLLVRPRVLGVKAMGFLETKEPRVFAVEFEGPVRDTDSFDIAIPAGYVVDDLPPAVDVDYSFASYHSKTEFKDNAIHYTRTFEVKELSVPVGRVGELKKFYRIIAGDERNTAVLKTAQ